MKISSGFRWLGDLCTCRIGAAFSDQEIHDAPHQVIVGAADQRCGLSFLIDQADDQESLEVVGKR